jgi:Fe-S oxidoreductase
MLRQDYLDLLDDPGASQVARSTVELTSYLRILQEQGRLPPVKSDSIQGKIGHHVPCHVKALQQGIHGPALLRQAGLTVETLDVSCSGMAGVYGLQSAHFETSLDAGKPMLRRFAEGDIVLGSSECSSCRMQMEHAGKKPALHPVQYLAYLYGLMPRPDRLVGTTRW